MILTKKDGLNFVFNTKDGKRVSAYIPLVKIIERLEDEAFEIITKPNCVCSSCSVNNFCECDPINEEAEFQHIELSLAFCKCNKPSPDIMYGKTCTECLLNIN